MIPPLVVEGSTDLPPSNASVQPIIPSNQPQSLRCQIGRHSNHRLSVRSLMLNATSDSQSPKHAAHRNELAAPPGGVEHLKHAGVVLQQQFRGLRRRVQTVRAHHAVTELSQCTTIRHDSSLPTKSALVSPSSKDGEEGEGKIQRPFKLTPKKESSTPIPSHTIKIKLHDRLDATPESLPEAVCLWIDASHQLITGPEMHRVLTSTGAVYFHCASICIKTITLPITLPIYVSCTAVQTMTSVVGGIVVKTAAAFENSKPLLQQSSGQGSEEQHSGLIGGLFSLPGTILFITGQVVATVVAPLLGIQSHHCNRENDSSGQSSGVSSSPEKVVYDAASPARDATLLPSVDFLDRLRLDYVCQEVVDEKTLPCRKLFHEEFKVDIPRKERSQFLLRVNDWCVARPTDDSDIYYMDISPSAMDSLSNQELFAVALDHFVQGAFALLSSHPICRIVDYTNILPTQLVRWHPEGATKRILREMDQSLSTYPSDFDRDVLIWSGRFQHDIENGYGRKHGFFLARGCIPMSPERFVKLLWDNTRTSEYNNFCLGRFTLHGISKVMDDDNDFLGGATSSASKIIQSEMRVPFAGITVKAICLMHVRPLPTGDGFMICSRTLDVGPVGIHTTTSQLRENVAPAKNEILWGVNVLRSVPNDPNKTQLTSLSQVGSGVPSFLAQKIGLMGIADFFKNVRHVAEQN
jgi:hypothetical protein